MYGELNLEEAMDLSYDRQQNDDIQFAAITRSLTGIQGLLDSFNGSI
jgi:hypothetical protein